MSIQENLTAVNQELESSRRVADLAYFESNPTDYKVKPSVLNEARELLMGGLDVAIVDAPDTDELSQSKRAQLDEFADYLTNAPNGAAVFREIPAISGWAPLTKRAIALHPLYRAGFAQTLGEGIDPAVYDTPLFPQPDGSMKSAKELLFAEKKPEIAAKIVKDHETFLNTPIDDLSRDIFRGSRDGEAIRNRARIAIDLTAEHFNTAEYDGHPLTSASLACGAAGPVYELVNDMSAKGYQFDKVLLVDKDQMALASAHSLASDAGVAEKVQLERRDLLAEEMTDYIEPNSVDVVDLLGLFEYIPNDERFGALATQLLARVKTILRPGGVVIFGNMLAERDQQDFFKNVVKWPPLQQRKVSEVLSIIDQAGFDVEGVKTRISARDGVYAVYAVPLKADGALGLAAPAAA
jgi:SAM-dependent methyltransferase